MDHGDQRTFRWWRNRLPRHLVMVAGLAAILLLAAGCASSGKSGTARPSLANRPSSTATLTFLEPKPGTVITGATLNVRLSLSGARIIPETKTDLRPDEGHIHVYLDGKTVSMTYGLDQQVAVTKGTHLLQAEYVAADHFPFNPRVIVVVTVTAE